VRIIVHYVLAVAICTVYGSQVDQMMAVLPPLNLWVDLLIAYATAYILCQLLEKRIVNPVDYLRGRGVSRTRGFWVLVKKSRHFNIILLWVVYNLCKGATHGQTGS